MFLLRILNISLKYNFLFFIYFILFSFLYKYQNNITNETDENDKRMSRRHREDVIQRYPIRLINYNLI